MEKIKLQIVDISLGKDRYQFLLKNVKEEQREKALRYKNEKDQYRSLISSWFVNKLSNEELMKNENGKPYYKNGPHFNVSHSGKYVVIAIAQNDVGVDMEEAVEKDMSVLLKIFNEAEAKIIKEYQDFYFLWCAKESLLKCIGSSLGKVREIPSLPLNGLKTFKGVDYQCQTIIYDKHVISITRKGLEPFEIETEIINKL